MTRRAYATRVVCDVDGTTAELPIPEPGRLNGPVPEGWLPTRILILSPEGKTLLGDICPACMQRPLAELLAPFIGDGP